MREVITALTDELRRLKTRGVKNVVVSDESLAKLRALVAERYGKTEATTQMQSVTEVSHSADAARAINSTAKNLETPRIHAPTKSTPQRVAPAKSEPKLAAPPIVRLPEGDKKTRWAALLECVVNDAECRKHLRPGKKVVLGIGNLDAKIFFCGEAPGAEEEIQGEPFVGPAGQLLTKMIQAMGVKRDDIYIGTIMNWRPEMPVEYGATEQIGNRPPTDEEMAYCLPYLRAQIEIVNPKLIVALGSTAAKGLLGANQFTTISAIRGKWLEFEGKPLIVTYHPSYILRSPTNRTKRAVWEDFLKLMERAELPISEKQRGYFLG